MNLAQMSTIWYLKFMSSESPLRNRVKELRSRLGLRQTDLADEIGVTRQTIIAIEKGRLNPSIVVSLKVARVLREPVDYVFFLDRESAPVQRTTPSDPTSRRPHRPALNKPAVAAASKDDKGNPEQAIWDF
jgi:putative transcriptional regulator